VPEFTEDEIARLFGDEAADSEDINRLRQYYFKTDTYSNFVADRPIRILVGHKGIGKSALFRVAMSEDEDANKLSISIRPDDIAQIGEDGDLNKMIQKWKDGLIDIITRRSLQALGVADQNLINRAAHAGGHLLEFLAQTFQGINLAPAAAAVRQRFVTNKIIAVYIDDLDRGWKGRRQDIERISALLNAIRDMSRDNDGLRFRISLRSDVYYLVRTSDESTDKIEGNVLWQSWTNHEIFVLLVKRIETFFGNTVDETALTKKPQKDLAIHLDKILEGRFAGLGRWRNVPIHIVLMSMIRNRPRDLVKLLTLAAREASKDRATLIRTPHLRHVFAEYSQGRVQDTINEYRSELPGVDRLILNMKPTQRTARAQDSFTYTTAELLEKIKRIQEQGAFKSASGSLMTPKQLAGFLYKINFLTARKEVGDKVQWKYFEQNRYLSNELVDFGFDWEVHPAYRWALQPDAPDAIYDQLSIISG
jgi:hypothetical protein